MGSIFARRRLRWGSGPIRTQLAALLVCGWLLTLAACTPQAATSTAPPAPYFSATDVSMDSPTDGWAVGRWITPASAPYSAPTITSAMAHYQDGQWRLAPTSAAANLGPYEVYRLVRMLSSTDGWATTQGAIYHYDGVRWSLALPASASITLADLQMYSPDLGWAVGPDGILQYTHGAWANVTASLPPPPADWESQWPYPGLRSVSIASPTDVWAMGDAGVIWRYDGAHWRMVASPYFPNRYYASASLNGFVATDAQLAHFTLLSHAAEALNASQWLSSAQGWAVGGANPYTNIDDWGPAVVEQYQGGAWRVTHIVNTSVTRQVGKPVFLAVAMVSPQEGWIGGAWGRLVQGGTGDARVGDASVPSPLLLHYYAGQWTFDSAPAVGAIHRLVMLSADDGWAASDGGLLHYTSGQWRLVSVQPAS